jgi:hypothetical protein
MGFMEVVIPVTLFGITGGVIIIALIARHRERMSMVEKGMSAEDIKALYVRGVTQKNPLGSLKWGMLLVAVGLAVLAGLYFDTTFYAPEGIYPGLIALFGGIALIVFYSIARKQAS